MKVKVVADSISPQGSRITTMHLVYPRVIHSEMLRHRNFARCVRSSRAVPVKRMMREVLLSPWIPTHWRRNERGMQGYQELSVLRMEIGQLLYRVGALVACALAWLIARLGVHKQLPNRLLEPFMLVHEVITATNQAFIPGVGFVYPWKDFFALRCAGDAEPHIQELAYRMREVYKTSIPVIRAHHLPFTEDGDQEAELASAMRCARTSYFAPGTRDRDPIADASRALELWGAKHLSPFEHPAKAADGEYGFYVGWRSLRHERGRR
jgi:hypothetical protein